MAYIWEKMYSVIGFNMKDLMSTVPRYGIIFWLFATADAQVCLNFNMKALAMQSNSLDALFSTLVFVLLCKING